MSTGGSNFWTIEAGFPLLAGLEARASGSVCLVPEAYFVVV